MKDNIYKFNCERSMKEYLQSNGYEPKEYNKKLPKEEEQRLKDTVNSLKL